MTKDFRGFAEIFDTGDEYQRIRFVVKQMMLGMATTQLVQVKAVNGETIDVQPMVHQIDGKGNSIPHGVINSIPYFSMRCGGSAIRMTPKVGDIGMCCFCSSDTSSVRKTKAPANPGSRRRFSWSDGLYIGGFLGQEPTQFITIDDETGISIQSADGKPISLSTTDKVDITGPVATDTEYRVNEIKVVGEQQPAIADPSGGSTTDSEARSAIGDILAAMREHGLIAS